jgi:hypothetical protein
MRRKFPRKTVMKLIMAGAMLAVLTTCEKPERIISFIIL